MSKTLRKEILRLTLVFVIAGVSVVFADSVRATQGGTCTTGTAIGYVAPDRPAVIIETRKCNYFVCLSETQLGCVEAVEATDANGIFVSGINIGDEIWRIPGLDGLCGDEVRLAVVSGVDTSDSIQFSLVPLNCTYEQAVKVNNNYFSALPKDREYKIVFRDFQFPYTKMAGKLANLRTKIEPITPTGFKITVSGLMMPYPVFQNLPPYEINWDTGFGIMGKMPAQFDKWTGSVNFGFWAWPKDACNGSGYASVATNATLSSEPKWESDSITFSAAAPHFDPSGEAFQGIYEAVISLNLAKCRWGLDPEKIPEQLTLEIYDTNYGKQSAVVTTTVRDGFVYLTAKGFHYSAVKFVARVGKLESAPVQSIISKVKVTSLKCQNLKTKKTVKFAKMTCPKGWKKVN